MPKYNSTNELFQKYGWEEFFSKFQGYNDKVALVFSKGIHDKTTHVGDTIMEVSNKSIAESTSLST